MDLGLITTGLCERRDRRTTLSNKKVLTFLECVWSHGPRRQRRSGGQHSLTQRTNERPTNQRNNSQLSRSRPRAALSPACLRPCARISRALCVRTTSCPSLHTLSVLTRLFRGRPSVYPSVYRLRSGPTSSSSVLLSFVLELQSEDHCEPHIALPPGPAASLAR